MIDLMGEMSTSEVLQYFQTSLVNDLKVQMSKCEMIYELLHELNFTINTINFNDEF